MAQKSNFEFLVNHWPMLAELGSFAEKNLYRDPNTTLYKLRKLAEETAKLLVQYENIPNPGDTLDELLRRLKTHRVLPYTIGMIFKDIRTIGNKAVHDNLNSQTEALNLLSKATTLSAWFMEAYGNDPQFSAATVTFTPPQKIDTKAFVANAKKMEKELQQLAKDHEELLKKYETLKTPQPNTKNKSQREAVANTLQLSEKETRQLIDQQLHRAGWEADSVKLRHPHTKPQKGRNMAIAEWPAGKTNDGGQAYVDYALFRGTTLLAMVEAKRVGLDIPQTLEETKHYARNVTLLGDETFAGGPWGGTGKTKENKGNNNIYYVPFLYSANSRDYCKRLPDKSGIWFVDVRNPQNLGGAVPNFDSPDNLHDRLTRDTEAANQKLRDADDAYLKDPDLLHLRDYQLEAVKAVEKSILKGKKEILLAMATGTGKTRTAAAIIYRLLKADRMKRILFLVDRSFLGDQALGDFKTLKVDDLMTLGQIYDIKELKDKEVEDHTRIHVATVQGMVRRLLAADDDKLMPTPGDYDCIIVDEAHRGYILDHELSEEQLEFKDQDDYLGAYRKVLDYFDAVKIGLTATPALHTVDIFGEPVFYYSYRRAVVDDVLADHKPAVSFKTHLMENDIVWTVGEEPLVYNTDTQSLEKGDILPDEVRIKVDGFNRSVITENFNRAVLEELAQQHIDYDAPGKTLIFAVNDRHADMIVTLLKKAYKDSGAPVTDDAVAKITGYVKNQEEMIKRFKNEHLPKFAVTVDLLTTGFNVHSIVNLVFLRRVRSRILYEQMLGRATRKCPEIGKEFFNIYDAVGLYDAIKEFTDMRPVVREHKETFAKLLGDIAEGSVFWNDEFKADHISDILVKMRAKCRPIDKSGKLEQFKAKSGGRTPSELFAHIRTLSPDDALDAIAHLEELFLWLDQVSFTPAKIYISDHDDHITAVTRGYGNRQQRPRDYLEDFKRYIHENRDQMDALNIICTNPSALTRQHLLAIHAQLSEAGYTEDALQEAFKETHKKHVLADIITFIRGLSMDEPVIDHDTRIRNAVNRVREGHDWDRKQMNWLDRIEKQLLITSVITPVDFDEAPFKQQGGLKTIEKDFDGNLNGLLDELNRHLYAVGA